MQVKTVERTVFRDKWHTDGEIDVPVWIAIQALVEAELTGARWACIAVLVVGYGLELELIEIPLHAGIIARIRAAAADFWASVAENRPPDPDFSKDGELIARLYPEASIDEPLDLRADNLLPALLDERDALADTKKKAEKRLDEIKREIFFKLGDHACAIVSDGRVIQARNEPKKEHVVKASNSRVVRVRAARKELGNG